MPTGVRASKRRRVPNRRRNTAAKKMLEKNVIRPTVATVP
jgi:hypothetical protein